MKSPVSDLLVWGSKHSTERRQDEPSRPPTAYNLRKREDGVIPLNISGPWKSLFNLVTLKQMVQGGRQAYVCVCVCSLWRFFWGQNEVGKINQPSLLVQHNPEQSVCVCVLVCVCVCPWMWSWDGKEKNETGPVKQVISSIRQSALRVHSTYSTWHTHQSTQQCSHTH